MLDSARIAPTCLHGCVHLLGLTGGIAAGKSTIAARLAAAGATVIDADAVAREVVEPGTPGLAAIAARFGDTVIAADGSLDRAALAGIVFRDADARLALEGITHPQIQQTARARIKAAAAADPDALVVYDVPLLAESGGSIGRFDTIVVAHAPAETRIERLVSLRGMTRAEAERRVASQADDASRLAIADVVIDTSGTLAQTEDQVDRLLASLGAGA